MNTDFEQWQDEVTDSLKGMRKAEAPAFMYTRIMGKLEAAGLDKNFSSLIPVKRVWAALACVIVLCILNIGILKNVSSHSKVEPVHSMEQGANPYQLDNANYQLY